MAQANNKIALKMLNLGWRKDINNNNNKTDLGPVFPQQINLPLI